MVIALFYISLIFATIPLLPPVVRHLYKLSPVFIPVSVISAYSAVGFGLVAGCLLRKTYKRASCLFFLAFFLAANVAMLKIVKNPVEKVHLAEYEMLSILFYRALAELPQGKSGFALYFGAWRFTFVVGLFDEIYQGLLPNRYFDMIDIFSNGVGAALGLLLVAAGLMNPGRSEEQGDGSSPSWVLNRLGAKPKRGSNGLKN